MAQQSPRHVGKPDAMALRVNQQCNTVEQGPTVRLALSYIKQNLERVVAIVFGGKNFVIHSPFE